MADEDEARLGTRLGNYVLHEILGRGGMGVVYRAEHIYIHKPAAVKVLHRRFFDQSEARQRFLREAQTAAVIEHPNIVGVTDFGEAPDGTIFLVMPHVEGVPLDHILRREKRLALFRTLGILGQVTRALAAAHAKGIVHRDLKPENIMIAERPGRREIVRELKDAHGTVEYVQVEDRFDFATLLDFGAAKYWQHNTVPLDDNASVIGTPVYMAPETARTGMADARSDVYSVGVLFYELLTGVVPFDGETPVEIMVKHVQQPVVPPRARFPQVEITAEAERVILKALEKDAEKRQRSMDELHHDLHRCFGSTRFRRATEPLPSDEIEALRNPKTPPPARLTPAPGLIALTPEKKKRPGHPTPETATLAESRKEGNRPTGTSTAAAAAPLLLTKRKSARHATLPLGTENAARNDANVQKTGASRNKPAGNTPSER